MHEHEDEDGEVAGDRRQGEPNWRALTGAQLCRALRLGVNTPGRWAGNGCPCSGNGVERRFDLRAVWDWRIELAERAAADAEGGDTGRSEALEELRRVKVEIARIELAEKQRSLIEVELVNSQIKSVADFTRRGFQGIARKIAQTVAAESDPAACERIVQVEVDAVLRKLAETRCEDAFPEPAG